MRRFPILLLMLGLFGLYSIGCDLSSDESGTVTFTGQVLDSETLNPVPDATVRVQSNSALSNPDETTFVLTDAEGRFTLEVEIEFTADLVLVATADGFSSDQISVLAIAGQTKEVPSLRIRSTRAEERTSGTPSNILLMGVSNATIGIIESGSDEVSRITFQVADSAGSPVTLENEALVRFSLGQQPGGGEFIAPTQAATDNNGQVTVNLSSGTIAGVVQVVAELDVGGRTIRSKPVTVSIHGGLPDQNHFTLGPELFNFPGLITAGLTNGISVIVGDKYSNPVKPGTSIRFSTNYGVIEGSAQTDATGRGTVDLISANPFPPDGVAIIEAETADENQQRVSAVTPVLFSGPIRIDVSPTQAILGQTYTLTVTDINGNPLAKGTTIRASAGGTRVKTTGNTEVTLDDTIFTGLTAADILRGPGITQFTFRAVEDLRIDEGGVPTLETITIRVAGPNGSIEIVLTAAGTIIANDKDVMVEQLGNGSARIQAMK